MKLPGPLRQFVDNEAWTFAKTMPKWPHEYLVRERVDSSLFEDLVRHVRQYGTPGPFYEHTHTYFAEDGLWYWTMGEPVEETTIINRCREEDSFERRSSRGELP